jgi:hypothetical protein
MRVTSRSEDEVKKLSSRRKVLKPGWYLVEFNEVTEKTSQKGNEMLEFGLLVGEEKIPVMDWVVDVEGGAAKLRSAVLAVDALERYESGEIGPEDFLGKRAEANISIQQRRGFRYMVVEAYRRAPAAAQIVSLRSA